MGNANILTITFTHKDNTRNLLEINKDEDYSICILRHFPNEFTSVE